MHLSVILLCSGNEQNTVNQLYSNKLQSTSVGCDSNDFPEKYRVRKHPPGMPTQTNSKHCAS